jgi:hypothetical protein
VKLKSIKMMKTLYIIIIAALLSTLYSCEDILTEEVYSQLGTENYLATENGIETVLFQAYFNMQTHGHAFSIQLHEDLVVTGRGDGERGAWEGSTIAPFRFWTWTSSFWPLSNHWNRSYNMIYNTNVVLDNINNPNFSDEFINTMRGEALALRAYSYMRLYEYFGPTPIHTSSSPSNLLVPRATEEEMKNRIESDFLEAIDLLPVNQELFGRITKGGAMGMLARYYLNDKQWQKAAELTKSVIDLGKYSLFPDYTTLFHIENEGNSEILWVQPSTSTTGLANTLIGLTYPGDFPFQGTQSTFPARIRIPNWFVDSFENDDSRADSTVLLKTYVNRQGNLINAYATGGAYPIKYGIDPSANGGQSGNDLPELRYADILLMRAEALNELNGPNPESIKLINQVRRRAGIDDLVLEDFASKQALKDAIFQERQWEFHFEDLTRIDMIRQGTFISDAIDRGIQAKEHHLRYPIPQAEIDANPNVEQNDGY